MTHQWVSDARAAAPLGSVYQIKPWIYSYWCTPTSAVEAGPPRRITKGLSTHLNLRDQAPYIMGINPTFRDES